MWHSGIVMVHSWSWWTSWSLGTARTFFHIVPHGTWCHCPLSGFFDLKSIGWRSTWYLAKQTHYQADLHCLVNKNKHDNLQWQRVSHLVEMDRSHGVVEDRGLFSCKYFLSGCTFTSITILRHCMIILQNNNCYFGHFDIVFHYH